MSEEQVATAIAVLKAYADGMLSTDQCDELDEALLKAYQEWESNHAHEWEPDGESMSDMTGSMEWLEAREQD